MNTKILACAAVILVCVVARGGEPTEVNPAGAFRFSGGERIKVVAPEALGGPLEQIVTDDGFIALPSGGEPLNIKGKSITEAQKAAVAQVERDTGARKALIAIALLNVKDRSVYVGGDGVKNSQHVTMLANTPLSLFAAIIAAGGIIGEGDPTHVTVSHTNADGSVKTTVHDISTYGELGSQSVGPVLDAGDVVKVPRGETFILSGEVTKGGPFNRKDLGVPPGRLVHLSNLVSASGGLKQGASRGNVTIIRTLKDGRRQMLRADLDALAKKPDAGRPSGEGRKSKAGGDSREDEVIVAAGDPVLQDGDVAVINASGSVSVLGRVRLPGVYPMGGETVKLSRAIALAGGFGEFAKQSEVIVWKMSNGFTPIHVNMSLLQKNGYVDIEVEEGDVIYVGERML